MCVLAVCLSVGETGSCSPNEKPKRLQCTFRIPLSHTEKETFPLCGFTGTTMLEGMVGCAAKNRAEVIFYV